MKFKIQIKTDNAAFRGDGRAPDPSRETARILHELATRIEAMADHAEEYGQVHMFWKSTYRLRDINGNTVGEAKFTR
jgi:hypothetical protein